MSKLLTLKRAWQALQQKTLRVLAYHSISNQLDDPWTVSPAQFKHQLEYLRCNQYQVLSLKQALCQLEQNTLLSRTVVLTFDDGFQDFASTAVPILASQSYPATFFVPLAHIGKYSSWSNFNDKRPLLKVEEIKQLVAAGFTLGAHGFHHNHWNNLSFEQLEKEISQTLFVLKTEFDSNPTWLAYPYGEYNRQAQRLLEQSGFQAAFSFGGWFGNNADSNRFGLVRDPILSNTSLDQFRQILNGRRDWKNCLGKISFGNLSNSSQG